MPMQRDHYPANWETISLARREAAGWQCEQMVDIEWLQQPVRCFRKQGEMVRGTKGQLYKVVLTVAHLDHNPQNNDPSNLRVLCQVHHLEHDHALHVQHAKETRQKKREAGKIPLFGEM